MKNYTIRYTDNGVEAHPVGMSGEGISDALANFYSWCITAKKTPEVISIVRFTEFEQKLANLMADEPNTMGD